MAKKPDLEPEQISNENSLGRRQTFLQRIVRWVIIGLLVFVIGFLTVWFTLVGPRAAEITGLQGQATNAQATIGALQTQVTDLAASDTHLQIVNVIRYLELTRFNLATNNTQAASAGMTSVNNGLSALDAKLDSQYDAALRDIRDRLTLAQQDLRKNDKFATLNDLEVVENGLLNLECQLFCLE